MNVIEDHRTDPAAPPASTSRRRTTRGAGTAAQALNVTPLRESSLAPAEPTTPSSLLRLAIEQNADLDRLERLMALQFQWEANESKKAFFEDFARFKAEAMAIIKSTPVRFENSKGGITDYKHAELSSVLEVLNPALSRHNLSVSWAVRQPCRELIEVTCSLRHALGYTEQVTMSGPPDQSGGKNAVQAIGSTTTYLQRYTVKAICGVAEKGDDKDGRGGEAGVTGLDAAFAVCDALCAQISGCKTDAEASALWHTGSKVLAVFEDHQTYNRFKDQLATRRKELKGLAA